jgi:hypothetical protein
MVRFSCVRSTALGFAERNIMEYWPDDHSGLILAARITLAHFSTSSAMNLPKSEGVIGIGIGEETVKIDGRETVAVSQ